MKRVSGIKFKKREIPRKFQNSDSLYTGTEVWTRNRSSGTYALVNWVVKRLIKLIVTYPVNLKIRKKLRVLEGTVSSTIKTISVL